MLYGRELPGYPFDTRALLTRVLIVLQRKIYAQWLHSDCLATLDPDYAAGQNASDAIKALLLRDAPCMIARFGTGEMETTLRHLDISLPGAAPAKFFRMLAGRIGPFWWDNSIRAGISWNAGLFPPTDQMMDRFGSRMLDDCRGIDILASWVPGERRLHDTYFPRGRCVSLSTLEPYLLNEPWTEALAGKTVLLVHPFEATIRHQYAKRECLFANPRTLPAFNLKTYKTIQSLAGNTPPFPTWIDALEHMCGEIAQIDFDIAIIGAGAYGMPLAAHIKRLGKKAVHTGGATQLLFGIRGGRWDQIPAYAERIYNEHWIHPLPDDRPTNYKTVESGPYW